MAKYTIELRRVCDLYGRDIVESWFKDYELSNYLTDEEIEKIETTNIWSKDRLAKKIVDHYFMREIGFDTPALFEHYAKFTMNEIMEKYLPVIYTNALKYDILINVDYTETFNREFEGNSNSTSNSNASGITLNSDTPQKRVSKYDILSGEYVSSTAGSETSSDISDNTNSSNNETYTKNVKGNSGVSATYQRMIMQYRETIRAVDKEIIDELNELFMLLY